MVDHLVLFMFKEGHTQEQRAEVYRQLRTLPNLLSGIVMLRCGDNFADRNRGYQGGMIVTFADRQGLEAYGPHPEHQKVAAYIRTVTDHLLVVDFEEEVS